MGHSLMVSAGEGKGEDEPIGDDRDSNRSPHWECPIRMRLNYPTEPTTPAMKFLSRAIGSVNRWLCYGVTPVPLSLIVCTVPGILRELSVTVAEPVSVPAEVGANVIQ